MKSAELTIQLTNSDGIPFEEYRDDLDLIQSDAVSSAFVEVPPPDASQAFGIKYTLPEGYTFGPAQGFVFSLHFSLSPVNDHGATSTIIMGPKITGSFAANLFKFQQLSIEENLHATDKEKADAQLGSVGMIEVRAWRVRNIQASAAKARIVEEVSGPKAVSEKMLKGRDLSHSVSADKNAVAEYNRKQRNATTYYSDRETVEPFHNFRFYYRTKAALRSRGVIPKAPSPEPEQADDPIAAELERARQQVAELERQLKRRHGEVKTEPGVKREKSEAPAGKRPKKEKVVIDLTED